MTTFDNVFVCVCVTSLFEILGFIVSIVMSLVNEKINKKIIRIVIITLFFAMIISVLCLVVLGRIAHTLEWESSILKISAENAIPEQPSAPTSSPTPTLTPTPTPTPSPTPTSTPTPTPTHTVALTPTPTPTIISYNMVLYSTQEAVEPHLRVFRNYSINSQFDLYGARESYGEKHLTRVVTPEQLQNASAYEAGTFIESSYRGYNYGDSTAYCFHDEDRDYPYFIESINYG